MLWLIFLWSDVIFWSAMGAVLWLAWPEWVIWWQVYQWKKQMKEDFYEHEARQRSGGDEAPTG